MGEKRNSQQYSFPHKERETKSKSFKLMKFVTNICHLLHGSEDWIAPNPSASSAPKSFSPLPCFSVQVTDKSYFIAQRAHLGGGEKFNVSCFFSLLVKPLGRQAQKMCSPGGQVTALGTWESQAWMQPSYMCCHMAGGGGQGGQEIFNTV